MSEAAVAWVTLLPSAKGFGKRTESELNGQLGSVGKSQGKSIGGKMSGAIGKTLKVGAIGAATAAGALIGTALFKGFGRLSAIDDAKAKLTGLGHSTKTVGKIMDNALVSVKGTAFGLDEAATTAAGAVAAGIKPGKALEKTLALVADAATIAGTDMGSMGSIFNKVAASNKVQMDVINQLQDAGIPALSLLADQMGVTAEEASTMASKGAIDFKTFEKAMDKGLGGAAQASGKTVSGSFKNIQAALGRLGASLLGGVFEKLPNLLTGMTDKLDKLGPAATRVGKALGSGLGAAASWLSQNIPPLVATVKGFFDGLNSGGGQAGAVFTQLKATLSEWWATAKVVFTTAVAVISALWDRFGSTLISYTQTAVSNLMTVIGGALKVIQGIFKVFSSLLKGDWAGVWDGIKLILSGAWSVLLGLVRQGWNLIKTLFTIAGKALASIFSAAWDRIKSLALSGIVKVIGAIASLPGKIKALGGKMKDAGKSLMSNFLDGLKNIGGKVGEIAGGLWNGIKGFLNGAIDKINSAIPNKIGKGKLSIDLPDNPFPRFARGTNFAPGGPSLVGERGPEIVNLPRGSQVIPNHRLDQMARDEAKSALSAGITFSGDIYQQPGESTDDLAERLWFKTKARG